MIIYMMKLGNRIFYDQDGEVLWQTGEMQGDVSPYKENVHVAYIDLEYGQIDTNRYRIVGVNVNTQQPILEEIPVVLTPEYLKIKELEDQLLLATDNEVGGIL